MTQTLTQHTPYVPVVYDPNVIVPPKPERGANFYRAGNHKNWQRHWEAEAAHDFALELKTPIRNVQWMGPGLTPIMRAWIGQVRPRAQAKAHVYSEGATIYSYGPHFPMAIRMQDALGVWFLVNADSASSTTSQHQAALRSALDKWAKPARRLLVPFSALRAAGIDPHGVTYVDAIADSWVRYWTKDKTGTRVERTRHIMGGGLFRATRVWTEDVVITNPATLRALDYLYGVGDELSRTENLRDDPEAQECYWNLRYRTGGVRRRGGVGITAPSVVGTVHEYVVAHERRETHTFIAAIDPTHSRTTDGFFLTALADHPTTLKAAYEAMKPDAVRTYERARGRNRHGPVLRQGDWFAIPLPMVTCVELNKIERNVAYAEAVDATCAPRMALPDGDGPSSVTRHIATRLIKWNGVLYARGTLTHSAGDHVRLSLPTWHRVVRNRQAGSWAAGGGRFGNGRGRVD